MKVVSLELAKTLKEKGYDETASYYYWKRGSNEWQLNPSLNMYTGDKAIVAAPTADELLELLPEFIVNPKTKGAYTFHLTKEPNGFYQAWYQSLAWNVHEPEFEDEFQDDTIETDLSVSNLLALMWIYLKKNDLLIKR